MKSLTVVRNPWPIAIIAFFAVFVAGIVTWVVFASTQRMDLVQSNYYEDEIGFQKQLNRLDRTRGFRDQVAISYQPKEHAISIRIPGVHAQHRASGRIYFYRPSDAALDRKVALAVAVDGTQRVDTGGLQPGLWKVRMQWTVESEEFFFDQSLIIKR